MRKTLVLAMASLLLCLLPIWAWAQDSRAALEGVARALGLRQTFVVSGDLAWNVVGDAAAPAPVALAERTFQLWTTPHGIVKAALAGKGSMQGRTIEQDDRPVGQASSTPVSPWMKRSRTMLKAMAAGAPTRSAPAINAPQK